MRPMFLRFSFSSIMLAAAIAAPAQAAPELTSVLNPCYVVAQETQREPIFIAAKGFSPLKKVNVYIDGALETETIVRLEGDIVGQVPAPFLLQGTRPFTLRLSEDGKPENVIERTTMVTRLAVEQSPRSASTTDRVRFKGRGFLIPNAPVYAHYLFASQVRKSVRLTTPTGPCGAFTVRRKQFPFKKAPQVGKWTIQFDQNPYYAADAKVRVPLSIGVRKAPKRASARAR